MADKSLYERLGGVFAIAAVVNHFSDAVVKNAIAGEGSANPELREWHTQKLDRLDGLKFMRTLTGFLIALLRPAMCIRLSPTSRTAWFRSSSSRSLASMTLSWWKQQSSKGRRLV